MVPSQAEKTNRGALDESSSRKRKRHCSPFSISSTVSSSSRGSNDSAKSSTTKKSTNNKQTRNHQSLPTTKQGFKRHNATHNYHDFSRLKPSESSFDLDKLQVTRGGVCTPFPTVLHNMMEQSDAKGYSNIVSWQSHGRAFLIHKPKTFLADVLPLFFKHSKLSSFQRQLSLYGFTRLTHYGPDRGAYYHQCFLRGRFFLTSHIARTRVKGTWVRTSSSPELEPNFYHQMEPVRAPAGLLEDMNTKAPQQMIACTPIKSTYHTGHKLLPDDNGEEADQDSRYRIHPFLHGEDATIRTSTVLSSDRTTRIMSNEEAPTAVQLLDGHSLKDDSSGLRPNQPVADHELQPPPLPSSNTAVSGTAQEEQEPASDKGLAVVPSKAFFPASSSTPAGDFDSLTFKNDDDLVKFLVDIDFESDFFEHAEQSTY